MRKIVSILVVLGLSLPILAEPAKPESVQKLMDISGAGALGEMMMSQMMPALKQSIPDATEEFWQDVAAEMNFDQLITSIIPVYQQHLSEEDIQAILAFYNTPSGKKLISSQPLIMQQSMQIGQQWGQSVFMKVMEKHAALKNNASQ
ncbi:MAG: DUF2059 domain-containing protein [Paraglaciecola sp.]|uniref:DUF2059 domain-containing protein n=1 Tax=Paraglaciecola sp. TaxID=1920173 RepID=UPI003298C331